MSTYLVVQAMDYKTDPESFKVCYNRHAVESELIDYGYMENPAVQVYNVPVGVDPHDYAYSLAGDVDPYPDWIVERGPRGGVKWERA